MSVSAALSIGSLVPNVLGVRAHEGGHLVEKFARRKVGVEPAGHESKGVRLRISTGPQVDPAVKRCRLHRIGGMGDLRPVVDRHQSARGVEAIRGYPPRPRSPPGVTGIPPATTLSVPERDARYPRDSDPHLDFAGCGHKHLGVADTSRWAIMRDDNGGAYAGCHCPDERSGR